MSRTITGEVRCQTQHANLLYTVPLRLLMLPPIWLPKIVLRKRSSGRCGGFGVGRGKGGGEEWSNGSLYQWLVIESYVPHSVKQTIIQ